MKKSMLTRKTILLFAVLIAAVLVVVLIISSHRKKDDVRSAQVEQTVQKLKRAEEQSVGEVRVQISEASGSKNDGEADSDGKAGEAETENGDFSEEYGDPGDDYGDSGDDTGPGNDSGETGDGNFGPENDSGESGDGNFGPGNDSDESGNENSGTEPSDSNYTALYADSVIMGDSVAHDIEAYGFLDSLHVIAENGVSLEELTNEIDTAVSLAPRNIFLYYGFNDIGHIGDDYERYKQAYRDVLARLQASLPDAVIYVNALFPVHDLDTLQNGYYNDIDRYNELIAEVCAEFGVTYLDNRDLVRDEYYYEDGYHFTYDFYPIWLDAMAQEAGLSA